MDDTNAVQVMQCRNQLSDERTGGSLRQPLLFEVVSDMREKLPSLCHLRHEAVEVVGLHGLVESDDVGVSKPSHELGLSQKILPNIVLLDLVSFDDLHCHLQKSQSHVTEHAYVVWQYYY